MARKSSGTVDLTFSLRSAQFDWQQYKPAGAIWEPYDNVMVTVPVPAELVNVVDNDYILTKEGVMFVAKWFHDLNQDIDRQFVIPPTKRN